jgi:hypothetical protein
MKLKKIVTDLIDQDLKSPQLRSPTASTDNNLL